MATRKLRCVALGESQETISNIAGTWLCETPENDYMEYEVMGSKIEMYLYWPGCDKQVPRPVDLLLIMVDENDQCEKLREVYNNFKNVVFKVVVAGGEGTGLAFAEEQNAKWTAQYASQDTMLQGIIELNAELDELMKKTFDSIDADNSGFIDMNELTNLSKQLGHELGDEELKVVFDELDENNDQRISFEEFSKWWKKGRRGTGNAMRKLVGFQTKANRFLEGAHAEITAAADIETIADDDLTKFSLDIKVGDEISDAQLGFWASAKCGNDTSERDQIAEKGGLDENERKLFARFSIKIAEGKDAENARDRLSSLVTKMIAFVSSQDRNLDRTFSLFDFKYRINDGFVDVYVIVDQNRTIIKRFEEQVWSVIGQLFTDKVNQEIGGSLTFAKNLNDIRDAGDKPPLEPLFEGINFNAKVEIWNKLQDIVLKILESDHVRDPTPIAMALLSGGSFDLKFGSINDIPEELRAIMRGMSPVPTAELLFEQMLPTYTNENAMQQMPPQIKQVRDVFLENFDADSIKFFGAYKHLSKSIRANLGNLSRFLS